MRNNQFVKDGQGAENYDKNGRLRSKTVAFRVSPEESAQIELAISLSGMLKQDYYIARILNRDITVFGSSKIHKAVYDRLGETIAELKRIEAGRYVDKELMEDIKMIVTVVDSLYVKNE